MKGSYQSEEWFNEVWLDEIDWDFHRFEGQSRGLGEKGRVTAIGTRRVVREKIASDLAYLLALPVASILLCKDRFYGGRYGFACVSKYSSSAEHCSCKYVHQIESEEVIRSVDSFFNDGQQCEILASMWVFDAWLAEDDRGARNNIVAGYSDNQLDEVYFIDFDNSMPWLLDTSGLDRWMKMKIPMYFPSVEHISYNHCLSFIEKIENLCEQEISSVIDRIPNVLLKEDNKEFCKNVLLMRREGLRGAFEGYFKGKPT